MSDPKILIPEQRAIEAAERDRLEARFEEAYGGTGPGAAYHMTTTEVLRLEAQYGLYCGQCGHGNGCEHGVPASRW